jgi:uncharacterized protein (DUF2141 family)
MSKLAVLLLGMAFAAAVPAGVGAVVLGPEAALCERGDAPAMLVRVEGLKTRTGTIRVQSYGGNPNRYFDKGSYLHRIEIPVPRSGLIEVCVPVAAPGIYAISVRHDVDGSGNTSRADGGGMSGNPKLSLFDVLFKRKPDPKVVQVSVHNGVARVPVVLNYIQGGSFGPLAMASR